MHTAFKFSAAVSSCLSCASSAGLIFTDLYIVLSCNSGHGEGDVRGCGGWEHGFGRQQSRGQGRYRGEIMSAEELDADLDRYQSEAMRRQLK